MFTTATRPFGGDPPDTIGPMSRIALYFASGESLYLGAALLLLAVVAPVLLKRTWMLRTRNVVAWVALAFMVMACPPFALVVDLILVAVFVLWFITSNQASPLCQEPRIHVAAVRRHYFRACQVQQNHQLLENQFQRHDNLAVILERGCYSRNGLAIAPVE